jgi:TPR repeat protein
MTELQKKYSNKWHQKTAENGNKHAQYNLGLIYENGVGTEKDLEKAFHWYQKAAENDHSIAMFNLANSYYFGNGTEKNLKKAFHWHRKAAENGHSIAMFNLAIFYENGDGAEKNLKKAFYWYQKAAENNIKEAMFNLANSYYFGNGTEKNLEKAFYWYQKAAENSHIKAMFNLALCYKNGNGTEKNLEKAFHWYQKAAENDIKKAMFNLANSYYFGNGTEKNLKKAFYWYQKAAENDIKEAMFNLANSYYFGNGTEKNLEKAFFWCQKAAENGHIKAMFNLAIIYENGDGTEKNLEKAFYWYQKAAKNDIKEAMFNLANNYYFGNGTEKNLEKAFYWYQKAAENRHIKAMFNLAIFYENGDGTEKDLDKAFHWYQKAAENENEFAQYNLGLCYENGIGTEKNEVKAFFWYQKAEKNGNESAQYKLNKFYKDKIGVEKEKVNKAFEYNKKLAIKQEYNIPQNKPNHFYKDRIGFKRDEDKVKLKEIKKLNNEETLAQIGRTSFASSSLPQSNIASITNNQQLIQQLKLNYGLFLNGYNIQPSKQAVVTEKGKLNISLYNRQPLVYTVINNPASQMNLLNFNSDEKDFNNTLQPSDVCINFPIAEIIYNDKDNLSESFSECVDDVEKLYELYGHLFARKTLIGGKLFIKELNLATLTQIENFMFYITWAYKSAKYGIENPINNLLISYYLPRIHTLDGLLLDTPEKISNWLNDLYHKHMFDIISYEDLIPVSQLKNNPSSGKSFETLIEKQPGVANFKEKLSLKEWVGNVVYTNLLKWIKDFHFLQGIMITKFCKMEISKKNAANFIKLPKVKPSNKSRLEIIGPTNKVEEFLIFNNIFSIKDLSPFPFINVIQDDDLSYNDCNFLVRFERYEIHTNRDCIKPSDEFIRAINEALENMKPFKALHDVFDEYGHVFPQKIILGRSFKRSITKTCDIPKRIDLKFESLEQYLDKLNISYLLTRRGNIIEKNELLDLMQNLNDDLEIVELDNIIPLYKILDGQQQEKIDNIINNYKRDNYKIIMTGIADLKDLDNNNAEHYKRINIQSSLEDENYEVIGSIISEKENKKLEEEFLLNFRLYDFNGFSVMIKTLKKTHIKIEECYILWMIIGIPSKLSVLSPKNQDLQVKYKDALILQPNQLNIKMPIPLSLGYTIVVNARHSQITYESINIKLFEWSENCISFQMNGFICNNSSVSDSNSCIMSDDGSDTQFELENNSSKNIEPVVSSINCNIYILCSDYKTYKIDNFDNGNEEYSLELIGYRLTEENFNENLPFSDE